MNGGMTFPSDVQDPQYADFYGPAMPGPQHRTPEWRSMDWQPRPHAAFLDDWLARLVELIDNYQPQLIWFDWWTCTAPMAAAASHVCCRILRDGIRTRLFADATLIR